MPKHPASKLFIHKNIVCTTAIDDITMSKWHDMDLRANTFISYRHIHTHSMICPCPCSPVFDTYYVYVYLQNIYVQNIKVAMKDVCAINNLECSARLRAVCVCSLLLVRMRARCGALCTSQQCWDVSAATESCLSADDVTDLCSFLLYVLLSMEFGRYISQPILFSALCCYTGWCF